MTYSTETAMIWIWVGFLDVSPRRKHNMIKLCPDVPISYNPFQVGLCSKRAQLSTVFKLAALSEKSKVKKESTHLIFVVVFHEQQFRSILMCSNNLLAQNGKCNVIQSIYDNDGPNLQHFKTEMRLVRKDSSNPQVSRTKNRPTSISWKLPKIA